MGCLLVLFEGRSRDYRCDNLVFDVEGNEGGLYWDFMQKICSVVDWINDLLVGFIFGIGMFFVVDGVLGVYLRQGFVY